MYLFGTTFRKKVGKSTFVILLQYKICYLLNQNFSNIIIDSNGNSKTQQLYFDYSSRQINYIGTYGTYECRFEEQVVFHENVIKLRRGFLS